MTGKGSCRSPEELIRIGICRCGHHQRDHAKDGSCNICACNGFYGVCMITLPGADRSRLILMLTGLGITAILFVLGVVSGKTIEAFGFGLFAGIMLIRTLVP